MFQAGDTVYILAKFIRTTRSSKKLSECYLGPFPVTERVEFYSYLVKLPEHLRLIHSVFYISQLEPAFSSAILNCTNLSLPPIEIDGNLEFKVVQVLNSK